MKELISDCFLLFLSERLVLESTQHLLPSTPATKFLPRPHLGFPGQARNPFANPRLGRDFRVVRVGLGCLDGSQPTEWVDYSYPLASFQKLFVVADMIRLSVSCAYIKLGTRLLHHQRKWLVHSHCATRGLNGRSLPHVFRSCWVKFWNFVDELAAPTSAKNDTNLTSGLVQKWGTI